MTGLVTCPRWPARHRSSGKAYETVVKAVANGDLPNAAISDDYSTLYLDDSLMPVAAKPAAAPGSRAGSAAVRCRAVPPRGRGLLNYLKRCQGKLGAQADEELMRMQKTCASILGFVHNHPEQLNRVRRFREYYLPTTRKLLDTAQGWGDGHRQRGRDTPRYHRHPAHTEPGLRKAVRYAFYRT